MPGPFTVVMDAGLAGIQRPSTIAAANGILTKAIWEGKLRPRMPVTVEGGAFEWGNSNET